MLTYHHSYSTRIFLQALAGAKPRVHAGGAPAPQSPLRKTPVAPERRRVMPTRGGVHAN